LQLPSIFLFYNVSVQSGQNEIEKGVSWTLWWMIKWIGGGTCMSVQLISTNQRRARRLTPQQKLQILKEWEATGNGVEIAQKYQVHPQTLYRWRKALEQGAQVFLSGKKPRVDPRVRRLERENEKLKEALALQTQELMLLKKEMNLV
jgi:transposase-like protein